MTTMTKTSSVSIPSSLGRLLRQDYKVTVEVKKGVLVSIPSSLGRLLRQEAAARKPRTLSPFQSPLRWGGFCDDGIDAVLLRLRVEFQSPLRWGGFCDGNPSMLDQYITQVSIPSSLGRLLRHGEVLAAQVRCLRFQSPLRWGGFCDAAQGVRLEIVRIVRFNPLFVGAASAT